jgi:hypothetical protein
VIWTYQPTAALSYAKGFAFMGFQAASATRLVNELNIISGIRFVVVSNEVGGSTRGSNSTPV